MERRREVRELQLFRMGSRGKGQGRAQKPRTLLDMAAAYAKGELAQQVN